MAVCSEVLCWRWICRTQMGDKTGIIQTDLADSVDSGEEPFYVNKVMLSAEAPTINHPETLHYSSINFKNTKPESKDIQGISSLTVDYAVVRYCGRNGADSEAKIREVSSMPHEDIYQVPHKATMRADMDVKQGVRGRDFSVSLPEKIEALSGSCVIIKCTFEIQDTFDKDLTESAAIGLWHKDGFKFEHLVFNATSSQNSIIKGNITGRLHEKDCTTIFYDVKSNYSGNYYFRIEGEGGLKWTFSKGYVQIEVIESPPKPTVKLYKDQDQEEVLEGSSVSLRCSAETLCSSPPPTLTWSFTPRIPLSESSRQQELLISDLNFTATHRHHRVSFTCTITYQLQDKNKTAQDNITLHVQYAPKISPSSSCGGTDVTVCFCEVDGNPSPELEWHLSGRPVSNSSNTSIIEERLNSIGLRSSITLHQSLTHTYTLQCVGNNTHGTASQLFQLNLFPPEIEDTHRFSISIGVAVGGSLMMMLCIIIYCARRENSRSSQTKQEATTGIIMTDKAIQQEGENESVYGNIFMLSSAEDATLNRRESLHYASIDFRNIQPESEEIRGISSLTTDYAVIHYSGEVVETIGSVRGD